MAAMTGIPSPLWTENQRLQAANAKMQQRIAELESERFHWKTSYEELRQSWDAIPFAAMFVYWDGSETTTPEAVAASDTFGEWLEEIRRAINVGNYLMQEPYL